MTKLIKSSIKEQVYDIIRSKILTQEYQLGEKINMLSLSQELNVSNTPIREALSMLERDGLIVTSLNAGPRVIDLTAKDFREITEVVRILLTGGYELSIEQGKSDALLRELRSKILIQKTLAQSGTDYDFARASMDFDEAFLTVPGNNRLRRMYDGIFSILFLAVLYEHQHCDVSRTKNIGEHELILSAAAVGNDAEVKLLIKKHYEKNIDFDKQHDG